MNRLSIGRCIASGYAFLPDRILTIIGLSWVAAVFFGLLRFGLFKLGPIQFPLAAHAQTALLHLGGFLAALLLISVLAIALTRDALGHRGDWTLARFVVGPAEVRLFLALVRLYAILAVLGVAGIFAVMGTAMGVDAIVAHWPAAARTGLALALIAKAAVGAVVAVIAVYVSVRLSFLLYPVAAAEPHASLRRVWVLGRGHVLAMLAIAVAVAAPVIVLVFAIDYGLMGQKLIDAMVAMRTAPKPDAAVLSALFAAHAQAVGVAAAVVVVVGIALGAGASSAAYLMLTAQQAEEAADVEAVEEQAAYAPDDRGHETRDEQAYEAPVQDGYVPEEPAPDAYVQEEEAPAAQAHEPDASGHAEAGDAGQGAASPAPDSGNGDLVPTQTEAAPAEPAEVPPDGEEPRLPEHA